jgi:hypothetical protein
MSHQVRKGLLNSRQNEGLLSFCLPQFSFLWRIPYKMNT